VTVPASAGIAKPTAAAILVALPERIGAVSVRKWQRESWPSFSPSLALPAGSGPARRRLAVPALPVSVRESAVAGALFFVGAAIL
jgi:hypothetical protein